MTFTDLLISKSPLLGHGPRTHSTGIVLATETSAPSRRRHVRWDVDAPRVHLGHAGRI